MALQHIEKFNDILVRGEKLVWTGKPSGGLLFTRQDWFVVPFTFVWAAGANSFLFFAPPEGAPAMSAGIPLVMSVVFAVLGFYISIGRFAVDMYFRSKTYYALTDQRLITVREGVWPSVSAHRLTLLPSATFDGSKTGYGTISFPETTTSARRQAGMIASLSVSAQLLKIADGWQVFNLVQKTQAEASQKQVA